MSNFNYYINKFNCEEGQNGSREVKSIEWVKENDPAIYNWLERDLIEIANENAWIFSKSYLEDFRKGDWEVEYVFKNNGQDSFYVTMTAYSFDHYGAGPQFTDESVFDRDYYNEDFLALDWDVEFLY